MDKVDIEGAINVADLSPEQQQVLYFIVIKGENVFVTGGGGTGIYTSFHDFKGKSFLVSLIVKNSILKGLNVAITAPTATAAILINGQTIHHWSGVGLGQDSPEELVKVIFSKKAVLNNWRKTDLLIIDEISMLHPALFEKLDFIGKTIRKNPAPFGGLQIILVGDFFQLPPVPIKKEDSHFAMINEKKWKYVFETPTWRNTVKRTIELTKIFRQSDEIFCSFLNRVREGNQTKEDIALLASKTAELDSSDGILATKLYSHNADVDRINDEHLKRIQSENFQYTCTRYVKRNVLSDKIMDINDSAERSRKTNEMENELKKLFAELAKSMQVPQVLNLRVGAQVMFVQNISDTIYNGLKGVVTGFRAEGENSSDEDCPNFIEHNNKGKLFPVVECSDGEERLVLPYIWKYPMVDENVYELAKKPLPPLIVAGEHLPIKLAWAQTVHKSQGQTLDKAEVSIGSDIFEAGQAYVCLSRIRNIDNLRVLKFSQNSLMVDGKVKLFYMKSRELSKGCPMTIDISSLDISLPKNGKKANDTKSSSTRKQWKCKGECLIQTEIHLMQTFKVSTCDPPCEPVKCFVCESLFPLVMAENGCCHNCEAKIRICQDNEVRMAASMQKSQQSAPPKVIVMKRVSENPSEKSGQEAETKKRSSVQTTLDSIVKKPKC